MNISQLTYSELRNLLDQGKLSCVQIVTFYLSQIEAYNASLNAFLEVYSEEALDKAAQIDQKIASGTAGELAGLVVGIKDLLCYEDHRSYAGSKILQTFKSTFSATAVQRLIDQDAIIIGRQNCDEFGMGSTNENSAFGPALNFKNTAHVAGGSSGGSAVAVQANMCHVSLGTDTGGSIRMPASFCGVMGLKPTYGRVSRWGLIAYASSFDSIGPIARNVSDLACVMKYISGKDSYDSTVVSVDEISKSAPLTSSKKIAYIKEMAEHSSLQPEIKQAFFERLEYLRLKGYEIIPVDFPFVDALLPTYYVLTTAEASSNLSRFDGVKYGHRTEVPVKDLLDMYKKTRDEAFGEEVKRRIMLGTFVLSADYYDAYYTKAQKVRRLIKEYTQQLLKVFDFIVSPTTSTTAYRLGEKTLDPLQMYLGDLFTVQANVAGLPAVSIPMGEDSSALPMGFQIMGDVFQEEALLNLASELV
ncbi:Asp-tRNA(Asn)/Glu-tRNA(Gln) amidotransferase subunit GatA [Aquirufa rosea]|uniref:Glutamyl-tRNA(Gln) amidotransferase subunit A n=1 Tax=Aquirufa rosea TaxID=2509241 RepID=A0A4Q1C1X9_9BACT|nr:Asp-tRNA(Asn)/Glu-tRNA(Gln) amidotransferase subunit GatA [Aquirufa rosea]RXK52129.1 Asp-tRNA(Asn)/Glu-tRNA(Gln) amidotransferase subunit GatA [Aquirufa rosea]